MSSQSSDSAMRRSVSIRGGRPPDCQLGELGLRELPRPALLGDLFCDAREEPALVGIDVSQALAEPLKSLSRHIASLL